MGKKKKTTHYSGIGGQAVLGGVMMKNKDDYNKLSIDALINNNYIIPGSEGLEVDVDKSYTKMKKLVE